MVPHAFSLSTEDLQWEWGTWQATIAALSGYRVEATKLEHVNRMDYDRFPLPSLEVAGRSSKLLALTFSSCKGLRKLKGTGGWMHVLQASFFQAPCVLQQKQRLDLKSILLLGSRETELCLGPSLLRTNVAGFVAGRPSA